jgi:septum formation protein
MSISWQREPIILASRSASRQAMLAAAGVAFEAIPADVDEVGIAEACLAAGSDPRAIGLALAKAKAEAVSAQFPERWVLGSDSLVSVDGQLYDKPESRHAAAAHLRAFSGRLMTLDSSVALARGGALVDHASDDAHLELRELGEDFIAAYLDAEWPAIAACVGCFRIEGLGIHLFERTTGSHFTILGMPLLPVLDMLRANGITAP